MTPNSERLVYLLDRNGSGSCTREELEELYRLLSSVGDRTPQPELEARFREIDPDTRVDDIDWDFVYSRVIQSKHPAAVLKQPFWYIWRAAAVFFIVAGAAGLWYYYNSHQEKQPAGGNVAVLPAPNDILPGREGAILTLADGKTILLDSMREGVITRQSGADLLLRNGQLAYSDASATAGGGTAAAFNTLSTPRGRQFHLVLPDGSRIWLNAASSITYPTRFTGNTREVEISGEVYFDVEQMKNKPFLVRTQGQTVEVLGTAFNINAYGDEGEILTTLIEGGVRVKAREDLSVVLLPGQQSAVPSRAGADLPSIPVKKADIGAVIAWKDGLFEFRSVGIQTMMRQMERWYDVSARYPKGIPADKFKGTISRNVSLSQFLEILKYSDINAKIEGKTVIITP